MSSEQQVSTLDFPFCGKWEAITLHTLWEEKQGAVVTIKYNREHSCLAYVYKSNCKSLHSEVSLPLCLSLPLGPIKISYIVPSTLAPIHQNLTVNSCTDCTAQDPRFKVQN